MSDSMQKEQDSNFKSEVLDFLKDLGIIVVIVLFITKFIGMNFQINGQSMYTSYYDKEFIIVDRLSYRFSEPNRGDVIVFKPHVNKQKTYFLKRIIGLPGDTLAIEGGSVFLKAVGETEFKELDERYLSELNKGFTFISGDRTRQEYTVPEGEYFVMGDNRNHSTDSRTCFSSCSILGATNFALDSDITGKVWADLGYFSFKTFSFVHPDLGIDTKPKWFSSARNYDY